MNVIWAVAGKGKYITDEEKEDEQNKSHEKEEEEEEDKEYKGRPDSSSPNGYHTTVCIATLRLFFTCSGKMIVRWKSPPYTLYTTSRKWQLEKDVKKETSM